MDRRTIVAYILILIVLFIMPFYFNMFVQDSPPTTPDSLEVTKKSILQDTTERQSQTEQILEEPVKMRETRTKEPDTDDNISADSLTLSTDKFWITLSTMGGGTIQSIRLKEYPGRFDNTAAELIPRWNDYVLGMSTTGFQGETIHFTNRLFQYSHPDQFRRIDTLEIKEKTSIEYIYNHPASGSIQRTLTFYPDQYHIGFTIALNNFRDIIANRRYRVIWNSSIAVTEDNISDDLNYSKAYSLLGDDLVDIDAGKAKTGDPVQESYEGITRWVAVRNKYFTSIISPVSQEAIGMQLQGTKVQRNDIDYKDYSASITIPYSEAPVQQDSFLVYIGPLDLNILQSYNREFPRMMNFGWKIIRPISKGVLWAFTTLHQFIPNYGLVLVLFGVVVKILVFPLTKKSYVSMKEMQQLQPKIQELREKYKDDSQKMNEEMMKIYKVHGVNPMGGCLPMLLQMPLLYALFIVFRSTIELRGAEFIWWITDLSQPDTVLTLPFSIPLYGANVNILPLIMAGTMILQQRVSATAGSSQQQKMMMWFMPILFLLIFNNFPSGLNLYYALFNIMTIIQQKWFVDIPSGTEQG